MFDDVPFVVFHIFGHLGSMQSPYSLAIQLHPMSKWALHLATSFKTPASTDKFILAHRHSNKTNKQEQQTKSQSKPESPKKESDRKNHLKKNEQTNKYCTELIHQNRDLYIVFFFLFFWFVFSVCSDFVLSLFFWNVCVKPYCAVGLIELVCRNGCAAAVKKTGVDPNI